MNDLHELPKMRDSLSYLYIEKAIVERKDSAVEFINEDGRVRFSPHTWGCTGGG